MVDLEVAANRGSGKKQKKQKQSPVENGSVKLKKKNLEDSDEGGLAPKLKKIKIEEGGQNKKQKKGIKFDETVKVREIENLTKKKEKNDDQKKKKFKKEKLGKKIADKASLLKLKKKNKENSAPAEKLSKKEEREKQKKTKELRKKVKVEQDVFDIGVKAKKVWEEVRREDCPEQKKLKLVDELHSLVQGNIKKIIFAHDTVRVVECLMAVGSENIRDKLFTELKEDILEMAKSKYAHFFVQKMLRYGNKEQKAHIIKVMEGHIAKLMKNKTAGYVVELYYNDFASAPQRNSMLQEFLGPEYRLFKEPEIRTVKELLAKHPEKKTECVKNLGKNVEVLIQKGCFNHSLVHTVLHNYLLVADPKQRAETIEQLRNALVHIIHSREGSLAALQCIWHGNTKDRKAIIKSFKTFIQKIATDEHGHTVLLGIFDQVDDTKLVGKAIIGEMAENFDEIISNKYGMRVVKYLMSGRDPTYIYVDTVKLLEQGDGNEHSKKGREVKCKELSELAAPSALKWIVQKIPSGFYDAPLTITFTCIINYAPPSDLLAEVFTLVAEEAAKPFVQGDAEPNIVENTGSSMMLKKIIQKDKERHSRGEPTFSRCLLDTIDTDGLDSWISCNRGAFLLLNCYETDIPEIQALVREKLKPLAKTLKRQKSKGVELLCKKLE